MGDEVGPGPADLGWTGGIAHEYLVAFVAAIVPPKSLAVPQVVKRLGGRELPERVQALKSLLVKWLVWNSSEMM